MADANPNPDELPVVEPSVPCRHLRNKGMYVYTDVDDHDHDRHPDYDNTVFWCLRTMKGFGPDDDFVERDECRNPTRPCYEPM